MSVAAPKYDFYTDVARIINAGQSRSVLLTGNVHDLFFSSGKGGGEYATLLQFLCEKCQVEGVTILVYELNGPIRLFSGAEHDELKRSWTAWRMNVEPDELPIHSVADRRKKQDRDLLEADFERNLRDAIGKPTLALEFLRQLAICSRAKTPKGRSFLRDDLLILIEAADFLLPAGSGDLAQLSQTDRQRVAIVQDWFSDPAFLAGRDSVLLIAESRGIVHPRVSKLPQVLSVEVPAPDIETRQHYIEWFIGHADIPDPKLWGSVETLARYTAGLSLHALRQLLIGSSYSQEELTANEVVAKVEEFIQAQLGDDVIEFKKPTHTLDDVIGFTRLKEFIADELLPRFQSAGPDALPGAGVAGPIGGGKTFIFEAVAGALDMPVLVLKNIRSQWFGQTDVIFERLRRVLEALVKVVIFVDEADTQFGGVGPGAHATERRLTGKIQQMMSDPKLRGRVIWLLMTARIHLLSPDIRRPGRVGDLILPILDPQGEDRNAFLRWVLEGVKTLEVDNDSVTRLDALTPGYSAAAFASLRSNLKAKAHGKKLDLAGVEAIVRDHIPPAIQKTRRYQTLQALVNCTRRSLLPDPTIDDGARERWQAEILELEAEGIR